MISWKRIRPTSVSNTPIVQLSIHNPARDLQLSMLWVLLHKRGPIIIESHVIQCHRIYWVCKAQVYSYENLDLPALMLSGPEEGLRQDWFKRAIWWWYIGMDNCEGLNSNMISRVQKFKVTFNIWNIHLIEAVLINVFILTMGKMTMCSVRGVTCSVKTLRTITWLCSFR